MTKLETYKNKISHRLYNQKTIHGEEYKIISYLGKEGSSEYFMVKFKKGGKEQKVSLNVLSKNEFKKKKGKRKSFRVRNKPRDTSKPKPREFDIIIQVDTREQDLKYINTIKINKRRSKDGGRVCGIERVVVKPRGCDVSTGDVSYKWKYTDSEEWVQSNLSIEIKKKNDLFSSIYTKKNRDRLYSEINRAKKANMDFWFLITDDMTNMNKNILDIPRMYEGACITHFDNFLRLNKQLSINGFSECICTGYDLGWVIRRLIKNNIKKEFSRYKRMEKCT